MDPLQTAMLKRDGDHIGAQRKDSFLAPAGKKNSTSQIAHADNHKKKQENGGIEEQIPALRVGNTYYRLSLQMMKSIWRHVWLKKGFVNIESAQYGGMKLRIPQLLFAEKMRTQSWFNVSKTSG